MIKMCPQALVSKCNVDVHVIAIHTAIIVSKIYIV